MLVEEGLLGEQAFEVLPHRLAAAGAFIGGKRLVTVLAELVERIGHRVSPVQVAR
jgi:hypothetical protein